MSNFKRPAILSLAAIAGAQLVTLALSPQPGQTSGDCLQWASEGINQAIRHQAFRKPADPLDGRDYWENNVWANDQPQAAAAPSPAITQPAPRIAPVPLSPRVSASTPPLAIAPMPAYSTGDADLDARAAAVDRAVDNGTYQPRDSGENVRL